MRKRMKLSRPSHATVVAYLALFVALGGSAYAVKQLPKDSVGTKQLKKNAVTKVKIRKNAVTGAKVKESTLGTVPTARTAATANTANAANVASTASVANSLPPSESWHEVGAPGEPAFGPEWEETYLPGSTETTAFYKDYEGIVHLRGIPAGPGNTTIFVLPQGYRPASGKSVARLVLCTGCPYGEESVGVLHVRDSGNVEAPGGPGGTSLFLEGVTFRAES